MNKLFLLPNLSNYKDNLIYNDIYDTDFDIKFEEEIIDIESKCLQALGLEFSVLVCAILLHRALHA